MTSLPLDELYLQWLYAQVAEVQHRSPSRTYWNLLRLLYKKEFVWFVANDDNRAEDGKDLRKEFLHDLGLDVVDQDWMDMICSFLEMLIALSRRIAFDIDGSPRECFWHLMHTLELDGYRDNRRIPEETIDEILNVVIFRLYRKDGHGGLFPLKHPHQDQRYVEIWYQFQAYLMENSTS